jgi:hypothetical protein
VKGCHAAGEDVGGPAPTDRLCPGLQWPAVVGRQRAWHGNRQGRGTDRWGLTYSATRFEPVRPGQSDSNGLNRFQTNFKSVQTLADPSRTFPGSKNLK